MLVSLLLSSLLPSSLLQAFALLLFAFLLPFYFVRLDQETQIIINVYRRNYF